MAYYPVNLSIGGRKCLIVGGGCVAERKALDLIAAGAVVEVCSPVLSEKLANLAVDGTITHIGQEYRPGVAGGYFIVICATDDKLVNRLAAEEARKNGALVNVADDSSASDFTVPARLRRGDILVTVSTNGKSPMLARRLREQLAETYGPEYGVFLELIAKLRAELKAENTCAFERRLLWRDSLDIEIIGLLKTGKLKDAEEKLRQMLVHKTGGHDERG